MKVNTKQLRSGGREVGTREGLREVFHVDKINRVPARGNSFDKVGWGFRNNSYQI